MTSEKKIAKSKKLGKDRNLCDCTSGNGQNTITKSKRLSDATRKDPASHLKSLLVKMHL